MWKFPCGIQFYPWGPPGLLPHRSWHEWRHSHSLTLELHKKWRGFPSSGLALYFVSYPSFHQHDPVIVQMRITSSISLHVMHKHGQDQLFITSTQAGKSCPAHRIFTDLELKLTITTENCVNNLHFYGLMWVQVYLGLWLIYVSKFVDLTMIKENAQ